MKKIITTTVVIATLLSTAGCAQMTSAEKSSAMVGAGIGCVSGAVLARVMGNVQGGRLAVGCAAGAAVGGLIGYTQENEKKLALMKAESEKFPGAKVTTRDVEVTDTKTGETKQVKQFNALLVPLPKSSITDPDGQQVYANLGRLAAKNDAVVTVYGGTAEQREQAVQLVKASGYDNVSGNWHVPASIGRPGELIVAINDKSQQSKVSI
ncbi:MAG: hypothetical protein ACXWJK_12845 [Burkholderiaceae bacterium]